MLRGVPSSQIQMYKSVNACANSVYSFIHSIVSGGRKESRVVEMKVFFWAHPALSAGDHDSTKRMRVYVTTFVCTYVCILILGAASTPSPRYANRLWKDINKACRNHWHGQLTDHEPFGFPSAFAKYSEHAPRNSKILASVKGLLASSRTKRSTALRSAGKCDIPSRTTQVPVRLALSHT